MIFFGAFKHGWTMDGFTFFKSRRAALWGVNSTVYMLRAYRKTFMGTVSEQWKQLVELLPSLRVPVTLLVVRLFVGGFFPQTFVRLVVPTFRTISPRTQAISKTCRPVATRCATVRQLRVYQDAPPASALRAAAGRG